MTAPARTVLIVEDSAACADALEIALDEVEGVELVSCRRAEDALARIEASPACHALVTDLNLPRMDGFELVRRVRARRPAGTFPILVISGDTHPDSPERAIRLGADAYFRKPYSPAEVRRTLEKLLDEQDNATHSV